MLKKIFLIVLLLFISSCGYVAKYGQNNSSSDSLVDFSISKINFLGDRKINIKVREKLNRYILQTKSRQIALDINSVSDTKVTARDVAGDPTGFNTIVRIFVIVDLGNGVKRDLRFEENFKYNNDSDKYSLERYESELKRNMAEIICDKLLIRLSNIK